ncbi:MAG: hypothetical protein WKF32_01185 [Thermoleophilaceae bacterium]
MANLVRILALTASAIVVLSFVFFVVDQLTEGSENQVRSVRGDSQRARSDALIDAPNPGPRVEQARDRQHSDIRELIDDGDDVLLSPFTGIVESSNVWASRLVPGGIGILLYGLLGMMLANALPGPKHEVSDWREAHS